MAGCVSKYAHKVYNPFVAAQYATGVSFGRGMAPPSGARPTPQMAAPPPHPAMRVMPAPRPTRSRVPRSRPRGRTRSINRLVEQRREIRRPVKGSW